MLKLQYLVFKQEWIKIIRTPFYGIFIAFTLCLLSILFFKLLQDYFTATSILNNPNQSGGLTRDVIKPYLGWILLIQALIIPVLSTQTLAQELQNHRLTFWINSPISAGDLISGKYFALISFILSEIFLYFLPILPLSLKTNLDWGLLFMGILGIWLFSCLVLAFGFLISSLFKNNLLALGSTYLLGILIVLIEWLIPFAEFKEIAQKISPLNHIHYFLNGAFYLPDLSYLLVAIIFCLIMCCFFLQNRYHNFG